MASKKISYKGAAPKRIKIQGQETLGTDFLTFQIDRPSFSSEIEGFKDYFLAQVAAVSVNIVAGGVGVAKRKLLASETPWGVGRIAGQYFGVRFRGYGKGTGRYDTGNMYEALKILDVNATSFTGSKAKNQLNVDYGYDKSMDRSPKWGGPYFLEQERGFLNPFSFDANRTITTGIASFGPAKSPRRVQGAFALPAGAESIRRRIDSGFSAAWNEAKRQFESKGFSASGVGTYIDARDAYRKKPQRKFSTGSSIAQSIRNYEMRAPMSGFRLNMTTGEIS